MAVGLRTAGSAVGRNRIRRIIRESFRLHQASLPAADIVVSARPRCREAHSGELFASLKRLWGRVRIR
jgi:ribonuclease P protein component